MATPGVNSTTVAPAAFIRNLRWYVCGLLLLGLGVNYIDRQTFAILAPDLQRRIGWNELQYSRLVNSFQIAYAVMTLMTGWIIDRVGTKWGLAVAMVWWSLAEAAHALASTVTQFGVARFFLGAGEAASMPASVKAIGEWFPTKERALATGLLNAATTVGGVVAPAVVPLAAAVWGWQGAFLVTGAVGFVWLALWLRLFGQPRDHPRISPEERALILEGPAQASPASGAAAWWSLFRHRQLWAHAGSRIITDPVYWFLLYWTPKFLAENHQIRGTAVIPYLATAYTISGIGSILGGYLSSAFLRLGWTVNRARKTAMILLAACIPFVIFASHASSAWTAVLLIGMALAVHQGWAANNFTLILDMFPARAAGSVFGIGGCLGLFSGIVAAEFIGRILQRDPSYYLPMFIFSGGAYLAGTLWIHVLAPRLEPAKMG